MPMKNILITSGPTHEPLDPVRYLTNSSSGEMGYCLAQACRKKGARVTVVTGPTKYQFPKTIHVVPVVTALEMSKAVKRCFPKADVLIAAAAVSDYRAAKPAKSKIKKSSRPLTMKLVKNPDILKEAGDRKKKTKSSRLLLVGFALETNRLEASAKKKLKEKNLDLIIGNDPGTFTGGFIKPLWIEKCGRVKKFSKMRKAALAQKIAEFVI